jgi:hypothetical protein
LKNAISCVTESRILALRFRPKRRSSGLVPSPKSRSNAILGLTSVGSGVTGEVQDMQLV